MSSKATALMSTPTPKAITRPTKRRLVGSQIPATAPISSAKPPTKPQKDAVHMPRWCHPTAESAQMGHPNPPTRVSRASRGPR